MKKIIYILATVTLFLTGCGTQGTIVEEMGEATNIRAVTEAITSAKRKPPVTKETTTAVETVINTDTTETETAVSENTKTSQNKETSAMKTTAVPASELTAETVAKSNDTQYSALSESKTPVSANTTINTTTAVTEPDTDVYYLNGIVYEVNDKSIVINETDFKKMNITVSDNSMLTDIQIGDTVEIAYNGLINENHIKYAYDAYSIEVTQKADKKYKSEKFEYNDVAFSLLIPEDWSSKEIGYPQEGNFTDWGIRFTPEGASGSMDISWHSSITITGSFDKIPEKINDISVNEYSSQGVWRFLVFENNYMATNNFFGTSQYDEYASDMELMINTLEFL